MLIKEIMTKEVITVDPDTPLHDVARLLFDHNLTGMPVVEKDGKVVGIVTEYDLMSRSDNTHLPTYLKVLSEFDFHQAKPLKNVIEKVQELRVRDIMTERVIVLGPEEAVEEAAEIFSKQHINPLPVVEDGRLVGIISRADIVKLFKKTVDEKN